MSGSNASQQPANPNSPSSGSSQPVDLQLFAPNPKPPLNLEPHPHDPGLEKLPFMTKKIIHETTFESPEIRNLFHLIADICERTQDATPVFDHTPSEQLSFEQFVVRWWKMVSIYYYRKIGYLPARGALFGSVARAIIGQGEGRRSHIARPVFVQAAPQASQALFPGSSQEAGPSTQPRHPRRRVSHQTREHPLEFFSDLGVPNTRTSAKLSRDESDQSSLEEGEIREGAGEEMEGVLRER